MNSEPTPGPWEIGNRHEIVVIDGFTARLIYGENRSKCVAAVTANDVQSIPEWEANQKLIAAAFDLLSACERIVKEDDESQVELFKMGIKMDEHESTKIARSAIKKAKG